MTRPGLEPFARRQTWLMPRPLAAAEWRALFCEYLATLARTCTSTEEVAAEARVLIGHIKLLALFDGREYLRVSAVSPTHPLTVTGEAPEGLAEVKITLNVLVYGLPAERLAALTAAAADQVAGRWGAAVAVETAPAPELPPIHHHHGSAALTESVADADQQ